MPVNELLKDVDIGSYRDALDPVIEVFDSHGIPINRNTISHLRSERPRSKKANGNRLNDRWMAAKALENNDATKKDKFYLKLLQAGLDLRERHSQRGHHFRSFKLTEGIGLELNLPAGVIRFALRAMRVDLVCMEEEEIDQDLVDYFVGTAEGFLNDGSAARVSSEVSRPIPKIDENWDHKSIFSWYQTLYQLHPRSGLTTGIWTPYELDPLEEFYSLQAESGHPLTPFDRLILVKYQSRQETNALLDDLNKKEMGIDLDRSMVTKHKNVLLFGKAVKTPVTIQV